MKIAVLLLELQQQTLVRALIPRGCSGAVHQRTKVRLPHAFVPVRQDREADGSVR